MAAKGYEVVRVGDQAGAWRAEAGVAPEFGPIEDLERAWAAADGDEARAEVAQRLGRALQVDGVVALWAQEPRCEKGTDGIGTFLLGVGVGVANIALMSRLPPEPRIVGNALWKETAIRDAASNRSRLRRNKSILDKLLLGPYGSFQR